MFDVLFESNAVYVGTFVTPNTFCVLFRLLICSKQTVHFKLLKKSRLFGWLFSRLNNSLCLVFSGQLICVLSLPHNNFYIFKWVPIAASWNTLWGWRFCRIVMKKVTKFILLIHITQFYFLNCQLCITFCVKRVNLKSNIRINQYLDFKHHVFQCCF